MITVVSTGCAAATKRICLASVAVQVDADFEHLYVEAADQHPRKTVAQNVYETVATLPPDRTVAWVDGDDWLTDPDALAHVERVYQANPHALIVYGQYITSGGKRGFAAPYPNDDFRREPWLATHLKTFKAGLLQRVRPEDLKLDGQWVDRAVDIAIMLPMLEMAGLWRVVFNPQIVYVYHTDTSFEAGAGPRELEREKAMEARIRAKPRYTQLPVRRPR